MLLGHLPDGAMEGLLQKASEPREDALAGARLAVLPSLEWDPCTCAKPVGERVHERVVVLSRAATFSSLQFCDIVSEGLNLGGVASGTGLKGATDDRFETCHKGSELALNGDLELEVGEAQPAARRVGKEGAAERALAALLKRELALVVRSEGRCPDAQGLDLEDANLFKDLFYFWVVFTTTRSPQSKLFRSTVFESSRQHQGNTKEPVRVQVAP